jgi:hypothetical protein
VRPHYNFRVPAAPFIVGVPRSGTTLLRLMLDGHSQLAIPPETGFVTRVARLGPLGRALLTRQRLHRLLTTADTWPDFHLDSQSLWAAIRDLPDYSPAEGLRTFYRSYAARFSKTIWGDKTPTYGPRIRSIARLLPEARFVHLVRDGRDVALSLRPLWFAPSRDFRALGAYWAQFIRDTRRQGASVPHYLEVRYEQLVCEPERTLQSICRFLDLTFEPAMLHDEARADTRLGEHEARRRPDGSLVIAKEARQQLQRSTRGPLDRTLVESWRRQMQGADLEAFDRGAGDLLRELGYAPSFSSGHSALPAAEPHR